MDYEAKLAETMEQIEQLDKEIKARSVTALGFTEMDDPTNDELDELMHRKERNLAMAKQYQDILNGIRSQDYTEAYNEEKLQLQEKDNKKNRRKDYVVAGLTVTIPTALSHVLHHVEWRQLGKIEQWETVHTMSGRQVVQEIADLAKKTFSFKH